MNAQADESGCSASGISSYLEALKKARLKYQFEKRKFENVLIDEWNSDGGVFSVIAEALRTGYYEVLVF